MVRKNRSYGECLTDTVIDHAKKITDSFSPEEWVERERMIEDQLNAEHLASCDSAWRETRMSLLASGLAERHLDLLYEGAAKETPAMLAVRQLGNEGIFVMSGNVGSGKTYAAHAWLLDAHRRAPADWNTRGICMITAAKFARSPRYSKNNNKFDSLSTKTKLVLDDLGVEFVDKQGSFLVDLDELIDIRWRQKSTTLVLTNLSASEFKERYGRRMYDRARDTNSWLDVAHTSMRGVP